MHTTEFEVSDSGMSHPKNSAVPHIPSLEHISSSCLVLSFRRWSCTSPVSRRSWDWLFATGRTMRRILGFMLARWSQCSSNLHPFTLLFPLCLIYSFIHFTSNLWFSSIFALMIMRTDITFLPMQTLFLYAHLSHSSITRFIHHLVVLVSQDF